MLLRFWSRRKGNGEKDAVCCFAVVSQERITVLLILFLSMLCSTVASPFYLDCTHISLARNGCRSLSCIARTTRSTIVSGSWDSTVRVWWRAKTEKKRRRGGLIKSKLFRSFANFKDQE